MPGSSSPPTPFKVGRRTAHLRENSPLPPRGCVAALICTALEVTSESLETAPSTQTLGNLKRVCHELRDCVMHLSIWDMRVRDALAGNSDYRTQSYRTPNIWLNKLSFCLSWSGERALPAFDVCSADSFRTLRLLSSTTCVFCGKLPIPVNVEGS